jgi:hypothetical protein
MGAIERNFSNMDSPVKRHKPLLPVSQNADHAQRGSFQRCAP